MILKVFCFFCGMIFLLPNLFAADLEFFIARAVKKSLYEKRYWDVLLHYKGTLFGSKKSEEDFPEFFNSQEGKTNPKAELIETIRSFFFKPEYRDKVFKMHPQCRFPARLSWFRKELETIDFRFPLISCPELENWKKNLNPEKIVLLFPAARVNIPASMFGHTLLRIDKKNRKGGNLLDYVVNFGAEVDIKNENPIKYTLWGIFGGYDGSFTTAPYYIKVQEYNEFEQRDLWEYDLNLSQEELNRFMLHFWEMRFARFDYFFFKENCSYQILSLIEAAKPEMNLREEFLIATIPADTIRVLRKIPGLLKKPVYRMSRIHKAFLRRDRLNKEEVSSFTKFADENQKLNSPEFQKFLPKSQAKILDMYLDYLVVNQDEEWSNTIRKPVLRYRAKLKIAKEPLPDFRFSSPPETGHKTKKVQVGGGVNNQEDSFGTVSFRMAIHDLLDFDRGYDSFAAIEFFRFDFRYYEKKNFVLDQFLGISVKNLNTRNLLPHTPSFVWATKLGTQTAKDVNRYDQIVYFIDATFGYGYNFGGFHTYLFFGGIQKNGNAYKDDYRTGFGPQMIFYGKIAENLKTSLEYKYIDYFSGDREVHSEVSLKISHTDENYDIRLEGLFQNNHQEAKLHFGYYF